MNGTILDLNQSVTVGDGAVVNGALISGNVISITDSTVNGYGFNEYISPSVIPVPEMNTMAMPAGACLLLLGKAGCDRMRKRSKIRSAD